MASADRVVRPEQAGHGATAGWPAALHRVDWRFLMPALMPAPPDGSYAHLVLLGGRPELADAALAAGLARRVSREVPPDRSADAVALLAGARVDLAAAAACLAPGGALYWEVDRLSLRSPGTTLGRVRRRLAAAGLSLAGSWAALPRFDDCRMYLPLDRPRALSWWLETLLPASTTPRRLAGAGLTALARSVAGLPRLLAWHLAVTATTAVTTVGGRRAASVLGSPGLPAALRGRDLQPLVLKDTVKRAGTRIVMLPFAAGGEQPAGVLKVPKLPALGDRTENEQSVLTAIRARLDPALCRSVPCPLGLVRWGGVPVGVEHYLPGRSLLAASGLRRPPLARWIEDLALASAWLGAFHERTLTSRARWGAEEVARWVESPLAGYGRAFGATAREAHLFDATRERAAALAGRPLPIVWQHRDFTVWNLLRTAEGIAVLDWEGGRPGLPVCDLLHFAVGWQEAALGLRSAAARRRGFCDLFVRPERGSPAAAAAHRAVARYLERLAIDPGFLPLLVVATWVELALRRRAQQRAMGGPGDRGGNDQIPLLGILADGVSGLFGPGDRRSHHG